MKKIRTAFPLCLVLASSLCPRMFAQAIPAGVGTVSNIAFPLAQLGGSFNYALTGSELISTGFYNQGTSYTTNLSGDLAYISKSVKYPFSAIYTGGVLLANSGQPNTTYQSLSLSQSINGRNWNFQIQDGVSYLPESPVSGLSGVPGTGDIGIDPVPVGPESGIGILTNYGPRVSNTLSATGSRYITSRLTAQANGFDSIQRFIGDNAQFALNTNVYGGGGGLSYHFDGRDILAVNYSDSQFNYPETAYSFSVQGVLVNFSRQWSRRLSTDAYVGPQILSSSTPAQGAGGTEIAAGASLGYQGRSAFYTLGFNRGVNNGAGVIAGSFSDNVIGGVRRQFGRQWNVSGSLGYSRNSTLPVLNFYNYSGSSVSASAEVLHSLGRRFGAFASYTVEEQTSNTNSAALNAFSGTYQIVGFGITYSPGSLFLGR